MGLPLVVQISIFDQSRPLVLVYSEAPDARPIQGCQEITEYVNWAAIWDIETI